MFRFLLGSSYLRVKKRYQLNLDPLVEYVPKYFIGDGDSAFVIVEDHPQQFQVMKYGVYHL